MLVVTSKGVLIHYGLALFLFTVQNQLFSGFEGDPLLYLFDSLLYTKSSLLTRKALGAIGGYFVDRTMAIEQTKEVVCLVSFTEV